MNRDTFRFPKTFMSIPRNFFFLSIKWFRQMFQLFSQSSLCSHLHKCAIIYCCQNIKLLYNAFRLCCSLLCTYHMYWLWTHSILESLCIGCTIIVQTPCKHINIELVVGIVPLCHFLHTHSYYIMDSPRTWCIQMHLQFLIWWIFLLVYQCWDMLLGD